MKKPLREILPSTEVFENSDDFVKALGDEKKFKPFGHVIHSFKSMRGLTLLSIV